MDFAFLAPELCVGRTRRHFVLLSAVAQPFSLLVFSCAVVCLEAKVLQNIRELQCHGPKNQKSKNHVVAVNTMVSPASRWPSGALVPGNIHIDLPPSSPEQAETKRVVGNKG